MPGPRSTQARALAHEAHRARARSRSLRSSTGSALVRGAATRRAAVGELARPLRRPARPGRRARDAPARAMPSSACGTRASARGLLGVRGRTASAAPSTSATAGPLDPGGAGREGADWRGPRSATAGSSDGRARRRHRPRRRALPPADRRAHRRGRPAPEIVAPRGAGVGGRARRRASRRPARPPRAARSTSATSSTARWSSSAATTARRRGRGRHAVGGRGRRRPAARGTPMDRCPETAARAEWYRRQAECKPP